MAPEYIVEPFGPAIAKLNHSDLCEVVLGEAGLRVLVHLGRDEHENDRFLEIVFLALRGFRYLDEGDLLPYWRSGAFDTANYLVFAINGGGWMEQERKNGMLNVTDAVGTSREWFIVSSNACLNVISPSEPLVRLLPDAGTR